MKKLFAIGAFIVSLLVGHTAKAATTYFLDSAVGSDSFAGTSEVVGGGNGPWATLSKVVSVINANGQPGDTILVKNGSGDYTIPATSATFTKSGAQGAPITIKNYPGHTPSFSCVTKSYGGSCFIIWYTGDGVTTQISWWVIEGLTIHHADYGLRPSRANNFVIRKNHIYDIASVAVLTTCYNCLFEYNHIHDIGDPVFAAGTNPGSQGDFQRVYAFYIEGANSKFFNNVMYRTTGFCMQVQSNNNPALPDPNNKIPANTMIVNNTCAYTYNMGAFVVNNNGGGGFTGVVFENNIAFQTCWAPLSAAGRCSTGALGTFVEGGAASRGFLQVTDVGAVNVTVKNNLYYDTDDPSGLSLVWCNAGGALHNATGCANAGWINFSGNVTTTNPNLTNAPTGSIPSTPDFTLTSSSTAAIGAGLAVSGVLCNNTCDIGAFESATFSSAVMDTNLLDVTVGMSTAVPIQGTSGFTVSCTGTNCGTPVVASAAKLAGTDSVVRLTVTGIGGTGNCDVAQTWTVSYSPGNFTDSANIGGSLVQKTMPFSNQAVTEVCTGSGTTPPASGLHVHYIFDEGTGTTVEDQAGGDDDGTFTGSPTWVTGKTGNAVSIPTNSDSYVAVPFGSGIDPSSTSLSACMWVQPLAGSEAGEKIFFSSTGGTNQRFYIGTTGTTWAIGIQSNALSATTLSVVAGWSRVCLVANSASDVATLYVNGTKGTGEAAKAYTSYSLAANFKVGADASFDPSLRGNVIIDDLKIWNATALTDQEVLDDYNSYGSNPPPPTGTIEQKTHRFHKPRRTSLGAVDDYGANGASVVVMTGGVVAFTIQVDCTVADCASLGLRMLYSRNGGTFTNIPDVYGPDHIKFYGITPDPDIINTAVTCCLTGVLTANNGTTQMTSSAVPVFDLAENASIVQRYIVAVESSAVLGDTYCFKAYSQDGNTLNTYTPSGGACFTVVGPATGRGF